MHYPMCCKTLVEFREDNDKLEKENKALKEQVERYREALTPSGYTKGSYIGEVMNEVSHTDIKYYVSWTATKEIMAMIRDRANG